MSSKFCFIMVLVMMRSSLARELVCSSESEHEYHTYKCIRPDDNKQQIQVRIRYDDYVDIMCEGHFSCEEFPKIPSEVVGEVSIFKLNGCGNNMSVTCALDGVNVQASQIQILQLSDAPLVLYGFKEINILELYEYGGEGNDDWLPILALEDMPYLLQLVIARGRTRLHVDQWGHIKNLRNLEFVKSLNEFPPLVFEGHPIDLHTLSMAFNNITKLTADHFKGLDTLEVLELFHNKIDSLPLDVFQHLNSLKLLDLSHNKIKKIEAGTFKNLQLLEELRISRNSYLGTLDKEIFVGLSALKTLKLEGCSLKEVPATLLQPLIRLKYLDLSYNQISFLPISFLNSKSYLRNLILSHNNLTEINSTSLAQAPNLRELLLDNNKLKLADELESPFNKLKYLRELDLSNNHISKVYLDWRVVLKDLKELDLSYNNFTGFFNKSDLGFSQSVTVNLQHNKIYGVLANTNVPKVEQGNSLLLLDDNPFICDCRAEHLLTVMREPELGEGLMYKLRNAKCASPPAMAGRPLSDVTVKPCS